MTTSEIRKEILNSVDPEWFNSIEIPIRFLMVDFEQTFIGLLSFHKFLDQQVEGWTKFGDLPAIFESAKKHFSSLKEEIENFMKSYSNHSSSQLDSAWSYKSSMLKRDKNYFTYDSPKVEFLIDVHKKSPRFFNGAYHYIAGSYDFNTNENFTGAILAYEFSQKDQSEITSRKGREKASISKIRNDFRNQLKEAEVELTNHLINGKNEYQKYLEKIDEFQANKESEYTNWFYGSAVETIDGVTKDYDNFILTSKNTFNEWFDGFEDNIGVKNKILDLEKTYEELLRLKKPAEYWKSRATGLKTEGWKSIRWLVGLIVFTCCTLYALLWLTPAGMQESFAKGNTQAIRWSIVYVTFLTFLAYGIRALSKVAFSSFHLARDAEEREQLTYVYLALIKDNAVDEKDKHLIMQSLFSRADTGLLKEDSGPTMPNNITSKIFGK